MVLALRVGKSWSEGHSFLKIMMIMRWKTWFCWSNYSNGKIFDWCRLKKWKELSLYCDNCNGQWKNYAMLALMLIFMEKSTNSKKISLNFLQSGHSMMTADSRHSVIEAAVRKKTIYAPSEWYTVIGNARSKPFPYEVIMKHFEDFRDVASSLNLWEFAYDTFRFRVYSLPRWMRNSVQMYYTLCVASLPHASFAFVFRCKPSFILHTSNFALLWSGKASRVTVMRVQNGSSWLDISGLLASQLLSLGNQAIIFDQSEESNPVVSLITLLWGVTS